MVAKIVALNVLLIFNVLSCFATNLVSAKDVSECFQET